MARDAVLKPVTRPDGYQPPSFEDVSALLATIKKQRQPVIDRIWDMKRARRGQWDDVLRHIPAAYRKMLLPPDLPQLRDMINRVAGLVAKEEPNVEVMPPSGSPATVEKASKEEARLFAMRQQIADQQDRDPYAMGIDAQIAWGEGWTGVYPDPRRLDDPDYERGKDEDADTYKGRYKNLMADGGVPICIDDFDPQTVFPMFSDRSRLAVCIVESEHLGLDIEVGMGYHPVKGEDGKTVEWLKHGHTLSEPYVASDARAGGDGRAIDTTHDRGTTAGATALDRAIRKIMYFDPWIYQCYLDGVLVEEWEHNYGIVPMFPALGAQTSDRDPGWQSHSIIDPALAIAKQVVMFSAIIASNAMQHGFPTPFLKNPSHGLVDPHGQPLTRAVKFGDMNLLGAQEEIIFPFLEGAQMPQFFQYMDYLNGVMEASTLSNFGKAIGSDIAGYAIAQIRSMQLSVLAPIYKNAERQWRKIYYFLRHIVKTTFPAGLFLRGAVEENDDGAQFRPILEYAKGDCTEFSIAVKIKQGIAQDEMAERKSALEMKEAGVWSRRRVMEKTGVEDPNAESQEIDTERALNSPASDQIIIQMAAEIVTERLAATRQQSSTPFGQALDQAKKTYMGGGGQFQTQGAGPANALPGGQPMDQNPAPPAPQQGGPSAGPSLGDMGVPGTPGGVKNTVQVPVGAPG